MTSAARGVGDGYAVRRAASSGGVLAEGDDDVVAEGFELAPGVAGLAAAVGMPGVPGGPRSRKRAAAVAQQVPDDDEDGAGDGDLGPGGAAAAGDAVVALAEEGGGAGGAGGGLAEVAAQVGVALAFGLPGCAGRTGWRAGTARPRPPGARGWGTGSCPGRSCDTRSHIASECMDWRSGSAGHVTPGECSMPVPRPGVRRRSCLQGCEARGASPRNPRSIRGLQARGKAGRVNASEPLMTPRNRQPREMG